MKKSVSQSKRKLFNPDEVATAISQNLNRDLSASTQLYGGLNSLQEFFSEAQSDACIKKYAPAAADSGVVEKEAFTAFLQTNVRMREVNRKFRAPRDIPANVQTPHERLLVRARALIAWVLREVSWCEIVENVTHSGGVTRGVSYSDTSLEAKFTWPMTATKEVALLFNEYLAEDLLLGRAIENFNSQKSAIADRYELVDASRATTVPKTKTKRRMIAIEPTLNMFFQQSLMKIMYRRLADVGLDVESLPERHKKLAWIGSVTGNLATIDFSSASDCVSLELLRYLLPADWFGCINLVRCPKMEILGETVDLSMVSTMGNAGTFPLETLVFWAIGVCTIMQQERKNPYSLLSLPEERDAVSVFGDDVILPTEHARAFMAECVKLGFLVNDEKSFFEPGPGFRESCGGDYLRGSNVRPFYLKAPTSNRMSALEPWLYVILNGVLPKYISYFGTNGYIYEKALLEYLFGLFRKHKLKVKLVPADFPDDAGLKTRDWQRLRLCYQFQMDTVACTEQGWSRFRYCRFQYRSRRDRDEFLRYATWLKDPTEPSAWWKKISKPSTHFPIRRKGGYVVARSLTSKLEV